MHKVFLSYYHNDDEYYRDSFEEMFGDLFINKSVEPGDIDTNISAEYIKHLIQKEYITDSSVLIVLIGINTYKRRHVDWEISAALNKKVGSYSGLLGILLPDFPLSEDNKYNCDNIPARLADNTKSGYAEIYKWDYICDNESNIKEIIEDAFQARIDKIENINNSRVQMQYDKI